MGRSDDDTPLSLVVEGSLSINGTAQIQVQVDGVLMSGGYRYLTGAAYGTLSFECYQYLGAGAHTVRILASTTSGNTGINTKEESMKLELGHVPYRARLDMRTSGGRIIRKLLKNSSRGY